MAMEMQTPQPGASKHKWLLIAGAIGGGAGLIYFLMRPKTAAVVDPNAVGATGDRQSLALGSLTTEIMNFEGTQSKALGAIQADTEALSGTIGAGLTAISAAQQADFKLQETNMHNLLQAQATVIGAQDKVDIAQHDLDLLNANKHPHNATVKQYTTALNNSKSALDAAKAAWLTLLSGSVFDAGDGTAAQFTS